MKIILFILALITAISSHGFTDDHLKDLSCICPVVVGRLNISENLSGKIGDYMDMRLQLCGVDLRFGQKNSAMFFIDVSKVDGAAHVSVTLVEGARSDRNGRFLTGCLWECNYTYAFRDESQLEKRIMDDLKDMMDQFSNDYLEANPREFVRKNAASSYVMTLAEGIAAARAENFSDEEIINAIKQLHPNLTNEIDAAIKEGFSFDEIVQELDQYQNEFEKFK